MAKELGLTADQKAKVQALHDAERTKLAPLDKQLRALRERIDAAATAETFDEAAVRALARSEADLLVEVDVARAKARHDLNALLTPAQRALAKKHGPPHGPGCPPPPPADR